MGKKKSKVSKQKQAKAKRQGKSSKKQQLLGGVVVSKGGSSSSTTTNNNNSQFLMDAGSRKVVSTSTATLKGDNINANKNRGAVAVKRAFPKKPSSLSTTTQKKTRQNDNDDEAAAFQREMASLQERHYAEMFAKQNSKKKKSSNTGLTFQAASFSLEKTPTQMLDETVSQLQTLEGVGQVQQQQQQTKSVLQQYASWNAANYYTQNNKKKNSEDDNDDRITASKNPFEALEGDDSDDDNEWKVKPKDAAPTPLFSMAPASFEFKPSSFPPSVTAAVPDGAGGGAEIDPDL